MAYREFRNEKYYESPNVPDNAFMNTANAVGEIFRVMAEKKKQKALAADQYKFDLGQGKFENDDKIFFEQTKNITERSRNDLRATGRLSPQIEKDQHMARQSKNESDWQFKAMTDMDKMITAKSTEDKYYDPSGDFEVVKEAAYGKDNDVYYGTRGERLENASKAIFKLPTSLRGKLYTSDYVKTFGKKENTKASDSPTQHSSTYMSTPFLTPAGVPGVTIDHAKQYLSSRQDGSVARWVEHGVDQEMLKEVAYNKERNPKIKSLSNEEALAYLKAHPEENLENKKLYADRVIERAQNELMEAADINRKVDYETKVDKSITDGLYNNDNVGHSYTDHADDIGVDAIKSNDPNVSDAVARTFGGTRNEMPGGNLRIAKGAKVGQAIPLDINPQYMINTRNGKLITNRGSTQFNLTGYQMAGYTKDGKPRVLTAAQIANMRPSDFKDMAPDLGVAFRGYTLNQGNKLGELSSRQSELDDQKADAIKRQDTDALEAIQEQIDGLADLKQKLNLSPSEVSDEDLMSAYKQAGINVSSIKQDMMVKPSRADLDLINKNITRGLDLTDPSKYSDDMKEVATAYRTAYQKAAAKGFQNDTNPDKSFVEGTKKALKDQEASGQRFKGADGKWYRYPDVDTKEAYDKLPPGSVYFWNGERRVKKK